MKELNFYNELCKIDISNNKLITRYPYDIKDNIYFTQHEIILNYKKNYCNNILVLEDSKLEKVDGGGNEHINKHIILNCLFDEDF